SNVGKSTLINSLTNTSLAKTSKTPGSTQTINFYKLGKDLIRLVDLPGYGFASAPIEVVEKWQQLLTIYLKERKRFEWKMLDSFWSYFLFHSGFFQKKKKNSLRRVVILIDSQVGFKKNDLEFIS